MYQNDLNIVKIFNILSKDITLNNMRILYTSNQSRLFHACHLDILTKYFNGTFSRIY